MFGNDNGQGFFVFMNVIGAIAALVLIILKVFMPLMAM